MKYDVDNFNGGLVLKRVREQNAHMDRKDFADALGISKRALESYEDKNLKANGEPREIKVSSYLKMCNNFGCDIDYLLGVQSSPKKEQTDIKKETGLSEASIQALKKEIAIHQIRSTIIPSDDEGFDFNELLKQVKGVGINVKTVDVFNAMLGNSIVGRNLRDAMFQYMTEAVVCEKLKETVSNAVATYNELTDRRTEVESVIRYAENVFMAIRKITSLSSLTMTNRMQTKIEDDFENFYEGMKSEGFSKLESKVFFDYLQSKNRLEALRNNCCNLLIQFLNEMSEGRKLTYSHDRMVGGFEVTESEIPVRKDAEYKGEIANLKARLTLSEKTISDLFEENEKLKKENNKLKKSK